MPAPGRSQGLLTGLTEPGRQVGLPRPHRGVWRAPMRDAARRVVRVAGIDRRWMLRTPVCGGRAVMAGAAGDRTSEMGAVANRTADGPEIRRNGRCAGMMAAPSWFGRRLAGRSAAFQIPIRGCPVWRESTADAWRPDGRGLHGPLAMPVCRRGGGAEHRGLLDLADGVVPYRPARCPAIRGPTADAHDRASDSRQPRDDHRDAPVSPDRDKNFLR